MAATATLPLRTLRTNALRLAPPQRMRLVGVLLESLVEEEELLTESEIKERLDAYRSGKDKPTASREVDAQIRRELGLKPRKAKA